MEADSEEKSNRFRKPGFRRWPGYQRTVEEPPQREDISDVVVRIVEEVGPQRDGSGPSSALTWQQQRRLRRKLAKPIVVYTVRYV